jgi:hypothetical protein
LNAIAAAVLIAGQVGEHFAQVVGNAVEPAWPGKEIAAGMMAGLVVGTGVGLIAGVLVRRVWGRMFSVR